MPINYRDPKTGKAISKEEAEKLGLTTPVVFHEAFDEFIKEQSKEQGISEKEFVKNIVSQQFMLVEFNESTGQASLKLYSSPQSTTEEMAQDKLIAEYKDLRENFAPVAAGIEYHKTFWVGSGFTIIVDDPNNEHEKQMKKDIDELCSRIYMDYYRKGLDRILPIMIDDALTYGASGAEVIYGEDVNFEDFFVPMEDDESKLRVRLVQEIKNTEWKKLKGIKRLKLIDDAITRLTPHFDVKSRELLYWGLDEASSQNVSEAIRAKAQGKNAEEKKDYIKFLPWKIFWISPNTRGTSIVGKSIIRPVLEIARMVRKIQTAIGTGFDRWADRKYFFVCGSDKRPWNKIAIRDFLTYLSLMIKNHWTGIPVPQGFDIKNIGGDVFEGTQILDHLVSMICAGMNYPKEFLETGRTRGDKAWLAWQVKYGANQRQLRRDVEHQLFQKHLWCLYGRTYEVRKQGVEEKNREKREIYIPKILWHAEGRWQQAEELKTLLGLLNVANPIGAELKLAVEMRIAERLGFSGIEFPSFDDIRKEQLAWAKQQELAMQQKEARLKKRLDSGVSKSMAPTGTKQLPNPPMGGTREPKVVKGRQVTQESTENVGQTLTQKLEITLKQEPNALVNTLMEEKLVRERVINERQMEKAEIERDIAEKRKTLAEETLKKERIKLQNDIKASEKELENRNKEEEILNMELKKINEQIETEKKKQQTIEKLENEIDSEEEILEKGES